MSSIPLRTLDIESLYQTIEVPASRRNQPPASPIVREHLATKEKIHLIGPRHRRHDSSCICFTLCGRGGQYRVGRMSIYRARRPTKQPSSISLFTAFPICRKRWWLERNVPTASTSTTFCFTTGPLSHLWTWSITRLMYSRQSGYWRFSAHWQATTTPDRHLKHISPA